MNKLNIISTAIIIYALSLFFVLLQSRLDVSNLIVIFVILPLSYFVAIYEYLYIKEMKHDINKSFTLLQAELHDSESQVSDYQLLVKVKDEKLDNLKSQIIEKQLKIDSVLPFGELEPYVGQEIGAFYGNGFVETYITKILPEAVTKFRLYKCGSRKYLREELYKLD